MTVTPARRWKRLEYERMIECGVFMPDDRVELINGLLVLREPQNAAHFNAVRRGTVALQRVFGRGWEIRPGGPLALDDSSEPEPDLAAVPGDMDDYARQHPERPPALIVEVSLSTLAFDREYKSSLYARAGVLDYWIVNLVDHVVEVRRRPVRDDGGQFGFAYEELIIVGTDGSIAPLAVPTGIVHIADLLPR